MSKLYLTYPTMMLRKRDDVKKTNRNYSIGASMVAALTLVVMISLTFAMSSVSAEPVQQGGATPPAGLTAQVAPGGAAPKAAAPTTAPVTTTSDNQPGFQWWWLLPLLAIPLLFLLRRRPETTTVKTVPTDRPMTTPQTPRTPTVPPGSTTDQPDSGTGRNT